MILRPLDSPPPNEKFVSAWTVVERVQQERYTSCWMITQPSHAALAGEIAGKLVAPHVPRLDAELIQAIALHDAGWGIVDAQAIMQSRSSPQYRPESFLAASVTEYLAAWDKSIVVAESVCAAGGYIVSRHFQRLAEQHQRLAEDSPGGAANDEQTRQKLKTFLEREAHRQRTLAARQTRSAEELELLTDVLQFCDLLSLYICAGTRENVAFPEYFGVTAQLTVTAEGYRLEPTLLEPGSHFSVAALRHPATKEVSGQKIEVKIT
jgi:hypothetical protein